MQVFVYKCESGYLYIVTLVVEYNKGKVICDGLLENIRHVFFDCFFALQVRLRVGLQEKVQRACTHFVCAVDSIFTLVQDLSHDESQRFAALLSSLWKHINLKLWQGVSETIAQVVDRVIHLAEDWSMTNILHVTANCSSFRLNNLCAHPHHISCV